MARAPGAVAAVAAVAALAGCGGASHRPARPAVTARHGLTRALVDAADAICRSTDAQAAAASAHITVPHDPDGPRQAFIKTALATLRISDRGLAELRALRPPPPAVAANRTHFVGDVQKEDAAAHALLREAESQNTIAAAETQVRQRSAELDLEKVSALNGFRVCGKAANA
jgi:hypothetical protein